MVSFSNNDRFDDKDFPRNIWHFSVVMLKNYVKELQKLRFYFFQIYLTNT